MRVGYVEREWERGKIFPYYKWMAQKEYKSRHSCVEKGIYWVLFKQLNFELTNKCYMHKPEFVCFFSWLVMSYSISTLVGYLIPNPVYRYMINI